MTTPFYAPPDAFRPAGFVTLPDDEAAHAVRVLRHRPGDEIVVVDGVGGWHRVRLDRVDQRRAAGTVLATRTDVGEPPYRLSIGLALLKNRNRFETFLEKAVELGVSEVIPLITRRTEKGGLKRQRAENLLVAAMKQSGRSRLVHLADPRRFEDVLADPEPPLRFLAHEAAGADAALFPSLAAGVPEGLRLLVGPEGGFTDDEVATAAAAGYRLVSLGPRRLRAETAAIAAATGIMLALNP